MRRKCRVTIEDSTLVGEIRDNDLRIGETEIALGDLVKIRNLGGDRRSADLKNGTVLEYVTVEAREFLEIDVPGIKGLERIDFPKIKTLESLKKG